MGSREMSDTLITLSYTAQIRRPQWISGWTRLDSGIRETTVGRILDTISLYEEMEPLRRAVRKLVGEHTLKDTTPVRLEYVWLGGDLTVNISCK